MKKILAVFLVLLMHGSLYAGGRVGTSSAGILKIAPGARPAAMGNAFIALANDVNAIYWNPAGLSELQSSEGAFMYNSYIADIKYSYLAGAFKTKAGNFGLSVALLDAGDMLQTTLKVGGGYDVIGSYTAKDRVIQCSYGAKYKDFSYGASAKIINQKILDSSANAYAIDLGAQYKLKTTSELGGIKLGATINNIGNRVKFDQESERLPIYLKLGVSICPGIKSVIGVFDVKIANDNNMVFNAGTEYIYQMKQGQIAGRLGFDSSNDAGSGITLGVGIKFVRLSNLKDFQFDYAFVPYGDLDNSHRVSLSVKF